MYSGKWKDTWRVTKRNEDLVLSVYNKYIIGVIFFDFRPNPSHLHSVLCSSLTEKHISTILPSSKEWNHQGNYLSITYFSLTRSYLPLPLCTQAEVLENITAPAESYLQDLQIKSLLHILYVLKPSHDFTSTWLALLVSIVLPACFLESPVESLLRAPRPLPFQNLLSLLSDSADWQHW